MEQYNSEKRRESPRRRDGLKTMNHSSRRGVQGAMTAQALQGLLQEFQDELQIAKSEQDRLCSKSLDSTLEHFLDLVNSVSESDTDLISLARDEDSDTSELAQKSTAELLRQTEMLAEKMNDTASKYSQQLDKVKALDSEVTHFSVSEVARCRADIEQTIAKYENEIERKSNEIDLADLKYRQTQSSISELQISRNDAARRQDKHETARNVGIATSVFGGIAALGTVGLAILCPPAGIAAAFAVGAGSTGAVGVSVVAGVVASEQDDNADTQRERHTRLGQESTVQQDKLKRLAEEKKGNEQALNNFKSALTSVAQVNVQLINLGVSFRKVRNELFAMRAVFSRVQMKLGDMTTELQMCGFAETRKELTECLNELLSSLTGEMGVDKNAVTVLQLRNGISGITSRTGEIQEVLSTRGK